MKFPPACTSLTPTPTFVRRKQSNATSAHYSTRVPASSASVLYVGLIRHTA
ncbi:hypothetical protein RGU75_00060 [Glaciimonas sp. CA11.2]|uniref:hypothetical protein n=1 Tax=Glaciimonas sp. CA11.2 TaxID=3048601 RepID=UPI002AB4C2A2|nr:hypothetical protein [Glaciimonas sp. CA11.2]MDY7544632.1 hypothetical protein [Glaciimonas sp. CA11.2]